MVQSGSSTEAPVADLVRLFFEEATAAMEPWVRAQGGDLTCTLLHANEQGTLEATTPDRLHGFFHAVAEFRTPDLIGEISFGDKELLIETVVSPLGRPLHHGLWEWADAVGKAELPPRQTVWVLQPDRMRTIVRGMAHALQSLAAVIAASDDDVVQRMEAARAIVRSAQEADRRKSKHDGTVHLASEAFRHRNWSRVIELLTSVPDTLSPAEVAKLRYAQSQLE